MPLYSLAKLNTSTNIADLIIVANDATGGPTSLNNGGILVYGFMISVFIVITLAMSRWGALTALMTSSYVCFTLSSLLALAKVISPLFVIGFAVLMVFTTAYAYMSKRQGAT